MSYPPSSEWTREISGISGGFDAVQYNTETPVIQIANLHGDIVGEVLDSETATGLKSSQDTTEYGVPTTSEPLKYAWLGAGEFPTELPSGVLNMGARSYVPQLGRFLQPDPSPGGSSSTYAYTYGNPLNEGDPSGQWSLNETSGGLSAVGTGEGTQLAGGVGIGAGAIMPAPVNAAIEAAFEADPPWDQVTAGDEEYEEYEEEWEEEEGGYEYVSDGQSAESGNQQTHSESGVLYQPLGSAEAAGEKPPHLGSTTPLCEGVDEGPCARLVPDDHSPDIESECNKTGQQCSGHRGGGHAGGGHKGGGHKTKKQCPPGYYKIPIVGVCIKFEWPSGPSPAPGYGPNTYPYPIPVE
jgi:RHS repeat-associated protein